MLRNLMLSYVGLCAVAQSVSGGPVVTVYRYDCPPPPQQGPCNRVCYSLKLLDADLGPGLQPIPEELHGGPPVTQPSGVGGVHWMVNDAAWFGPRPGADPLDDQADIQVDNPTSVPIYAWAVGVPGLTLATPIVPYVQQDPALSLTGWQSAIVSREWWNANAWTAPVTNDPVGNAADEVPPSPAPADWTPPDTSLAGLRFEDLFDSTPGLDTALLFWTVESQYAIQPGSTRSGFLIGNRGHFLSSRSLPFVDLGPGSVIATGNLQIIAEPPTLALVLSGGGLSWVLRRRLAC